ncbi:MAG: LAGLIDADG family homing endonuclease [Patescibacteria group bacterium]
MVDLRLIKPENLWYIVGLITTDGNLSISGRHINITSKDRSLLYDVRSSLFLNNKIGRKSNGSNKKKIYSVLQLGDKKFYDYLMDIGLTPKKSLTLKSIKVPNKYFIDFVRGVIDGNGNISRWVHATNKNVQWSLRIVSGSKTFLLWLKNSMEKTFEVSGKFYTQQYANKKNPLHILKFGKFAAKFILKRCYYNKCLALNRKLKSSMKCLQSEDGLRKYGNFVSVNHVKYARVS